MRHIKRLLSFILLMALINSVQGQALPTGKPWGISTGWYKWGYVQADSGRIDARRDTLWTPSQIPTTVYWQHTGVDSAFWTYKRTTGKRWYKEATGTGGSSGDTSFFRNALTGDTAFTNPSTDHFLFKSDLYGLYLLPANVTDTTKGAKVDTASMFPAIRATISSGGSQTPWLSNINGANYGLDSVGWLRVGVSGGIITENEAFYSEQPQNASYYGSVDVTITGNQALDVEGNLTLAELNITNAGSNFVRNTNSPDLLVTPGDTYVFSMDIKQESLSSGYYSVYDVTHSANIIAPTLFSIPAGLATRFTSASFVIPAGCTEIYIYPARDVPSTGTYFVGRLQVAHVGNAYIQTTTAQAPPSGSGGYLTAIETDSITTFIGFHGAPDPDFFTTEYGSVQFTSDSFYLPNLPSGVGNKVLSFNTSTGKVTYAAATRFGVSGEDDVATQDRVFDGGTHVLQMNWRSPYDATQTLNFFPYYHVDGMHNIAEMRIQANQSGPSGSGNYISVGVDNSSGVVLNTGDNTGEHKAILIRTDSVLVFTNNGATINTAFAVSGTGAGLPAVSFPSIQKATSLGTHRVALIDTANKQISYINYDSLRAATSVPLSGITAATANNTVTMGGNYFALTGGKVGIGAVPNYKFDVQENTTGVFAANVTNNHANGSGMAINTFSSTSSETLFQLLSGGAGSTSRFRVNADGHIQIGAGSAPVSILDVGGSLGLFLVTKTANYTADATDYTILCSTNTFTITLPAAAGCTNRIYVIKNITSGTTITIDGNASETIDGSTTKVLNTQYSGYTIQSNGSNWFIISTF